MTIDGIIGNYYGGPMFIEKDGKFYMYIDNYEGQEAIEITKTMFEEAKKLDRKTVFESDF